MLQKYRRKKIVSLNEINDFFLWLLKQGLTLYHARAGDIYNKDDIKSVIEEYFWEQKQIQNTDITKEETFALQSLLKEREK